MMKKRSNRKHVAHIQWTHQTSITKFILLGFGNLNEVKILLFVVFLVIYIVTMAGNLLIVALVVADQHLRTPMYFFMGNLSFLETCYTSVFVPRCCLYYQHNKTLHWNWGLRDGLSDPDDHLSGLDSDQHLRTPMYFFMGNLSFLETCYTSVFVPRCCLYYQHNKTLHWNWGLRDGLSDPDDHLSGLDSVM
ncbi:Olfactory receptor 5V1 [Chelonia mydas]|uniref:Olfactory receptor 5V1 n=1 Tax=Chelonia mydas TaxID=8469 RepID=M7CAC6_CHEMY|nr:Olfactory receptor 5V1 [Chelonia mydas]